MRNNHSKKQNLWDNILSLNFLQLQFRGSPLPWQIKYGSGYLMIHF